MGITVVVQLLSLVWLFATPWTAACQLPCPLLSPGACSNSCPLSQWCHPNTSSSVIPSRPGSNLSQHQGLFQWVGSLYQVGERLEASASSLEASVLPVNIQGWYPLGLTGLITLLSKGLSRVFSSSKSINETQPFYGLILTPDYWKNHTFDYTDLCGQNNVSAF